MFGEENLAKFQKFKFTVLPRWLLYLSNKGVNGKHRSHQGAVLI